VAFYVVSFTDIAPPVRYDGAPWETVQIGQATELAGPWTTIDTQALQPLDSDPSNPQARTFTTSLATTQEGFFTLTFFDAAGASSQPLMQVMNQPSEVRPTVGELGAFMRARTVAAGSAGNELGTFTAATRPTAAEADGLIDQAVSAVLMRTGADIPDRFVTQTRFVVLIHAAMLVELTFYRNEVSRDQSAYAQYEQLYKDTAAALLGAIADEDPASPEAAFFSVPIATSSQVRFQALVAAVDPITGRFDPTKLPVDYWYPRGPGGIPLELLQVFPWLGFDPAFGFGDMELTDLESAD
jgi:hypothetical protein